MISCSFQVRSPLAESPDRHFRLFGTNNSDGEGLMGQRGLASIYLRKQVGSVRCVDGSQLGMSLLRFVNFVSVEIKKPKCQQGISIGWPDVDSFFVGGLGGFPFFLLAKALTEIEEVIRFD